MHAVEPADVVRRLHAGLPPPLALADAEAVLHASEPHPARARYRPLVTVPLGDAAS